MTRRAAYRLSFCTGHVDLCPDCHAVLTREGEVAGDPREPMLTLEGWKRTSAAPIGFPCDICAGLEAYEEALNEARAAATPASTYCDGCAFCNARSIPCRECPACTPVVVEVGPPMALTAHGLIPLDATPTLAELEGEDCASY